MSLPKVLVVSLGGTITMTSAGAGGIVPTLSADDLLAGVPQLKDVAALEAVSMFGLPGASLTITHLIDVARFLRKRFAEGMDGAVVVQGTDTIEDTAFVLDLLVGGSHPVVVTGAMRGPQAAGADGPGNLLAAVRVAGDARLRGLGAVAVLNDEIHAARWVQKSHTGLTSAFESPGAGRLGIVSEGQVELLMTPLRKAITIDLDKAAQCEVALVSLGLGDDGRLLSTLPGLGYAGAVVQGMGAGHVPAAAVERIAAAIEAMPVVLCTRVAAGRVFGRTYGFPGSEMDLIQRGVVPAGHLSASKARLLLALLISTGSSLEAIREAFA
jgi:L-asparaginase